MASYYRQFRREFGRGHVQPSRMPAGPVLAAAVVVVLAAVAGTGTHHHPAARHPAVTAVALPAASSYSQGSWAVALLHDLAEPLTPCNRAFLLAWMAAEGGHWRNAARYNPLNTERPEPGSYKINDTGGSTGVQAYTSWGQGLAATTATLRHYPAILAALHAGNDAQQAAVTVSVSTWGTHQFEANC